MSSYTFTLHKSLRSGSCALGQSYIKLANFMEENFLRGHDSYHRAKHIATVV